MRCLSVARAFAVQDEDVLFVTADHRGDGLIRSAGFRSVSLDTEWTRMEQEIPRIRGLVNELLPTLVLVDSYYVTQKYLRAVNGMAPVAYIDDMNELRWDVSYLINYNIYADSCDYFGYRGSGTKLVLGPKYAPLRDEFLGMPQHAIRQQVSDILVSAGGADPEGVTEKIIHEICPLFENVQFHFIVGALNPRIETIRGLEGGNVILHVNEQHMASLMQSCDISVSAAGTTLYELCATGIPTITYILADNQIVATEQFEKLGIMPCAGDCRVGHDFVGRLTTLLRELIGDEELRMSLTNRMQSLVDGCGAQRIVDEVRLDG